MAMQWMPWYVPSQMTDDTQIIDCTVGKGIKHEMGEAMGTWEHAQTNDRC
eukprot:m.280990 g.280990  ORF g.280990 m.280990 type:complete len:50 (+) comp26976_c1_seq19:2387-2536(+)